MSTPIYDQLLAELTAPTDTDPEPPPRSSQTVVVVSRTPPAEPDTG